MTPQYIAALHEVYVVGLLAAANGTITSLLVQILKFPGIKVPAQKYPVPTSVILSVALSAVAVFSLHMIVLRTVVSWLLFSGATAFCAELIYQLVSKAVAQLRQP